MRVGAHTHDERCRRGAQLKPIVSESVVNAEVDQRKGIVFFRRAVGCVRVQKRREARRRPLGGRAVRRVRRAARREVLPGAEAEEQGAQEEDEGTDGDEEGAPPPLH